MEGRNETALGGIFCSAIETSDHGFAVLDGDDRFVYCNPTYISMFGLEGLTVMGKRFDEVLADMYEQHIADRWPVPKEEWLHRVTTQRGSTESPYFEVDTVDGRHLLVSETRCASGEITQHGTDITNVRRVEQSLLDAKSAMQRLALTDELTGLANRSEFLQVLDRELARVSRHGQALSLALVGVDYFQQILDSRGRPAADAVLQHFAGLLHGCLRRTDLAGRIGGEEFAVLLPHTQRQDALAILHRLCDRVSSTNVAAVDDDFSYSFSAGIVTTEARYPVSSDWIIACADKALSQARATGRSCVMPYSG